MYFKGDPLDYDALGVAPGMASVSSWPALRRFFRCYRYLWLPSRELDCLKDSHCGWCLCVLLNKVFLLVIHALVPALSCFHFVFS